MKIDDYSQFIQCMMALLCFIQHQCHSDSGRFIQFVDARLHFDRCQFRCGLHLQNLRFPLRISKDFRYYLNYLHPKNHH